MSVGIATLLPAGSVSVGFLEAPVLGPGAVRCGGFRFPDSSHSQKPPRMKSDTGPFALIPEWVLLLPISDRALRLYAVLGRYADDSGACWPSRRTLAGKLECSSDSIDRAKAELIEAGALLCNAQQRADGGQTTNFYTLIRVAPSRPPLRKDAQVPLRAVAAQNENHVEREPSLGTASPVRKRDELFDALCDLTGTDTDQLSTSGRGALNKAVKELRSLHASGPEVHARARAFARKYPNAVLTAPALVKHWATLGNGRSSSTPIPTPEEVQAEFSRLMEEDPL